MAYHQRNPKKQKHTIAEVQRWRKLMKENNWNQKKLAEHLGIKGTTVCNMLQKEAYGELRA